MTTTHGDAVGFFLQHAGYCFDPKTQTADEGRRQCAELLATAEAWLITQPGFRAEWEVDHDADRSWMDEDDEDGDRPLYRCLVAVTRPPCAKCGHADTDFRTLGGIDLAGDPDTDPYARVVVAELALELMPE